MQFTKMHGLGNDFIVVAGMDELPYNAGELAVRWCDRHFGIGADGLVFILPSAKADYMMRIMNSDGSEAEQCGNAIRCVAKYVYDFGLTSRLNPRIETIGAGVQQLLLQTQQGKVTSVRVDMGVPRLNGLQVPTTLELNSIVNHPISILDAEFHITAVSMGNPHCVIFTPDADAIDLTQWGPQLEHHPIFPKKTNVEFVTVRARDHLVMRVWERGTGPTLACGTGACASLVAAVLNEKADRKAMVSLSGGDLLIEWDEQDDHIYMTGPAETVFTGEIILE